MSEPPLQRLNYFNGQRLDASDLKLEQDYHIRVRRWVNKSLYQPGIARGLEVRAVPGTPAVIVSPGLAIDSEGREIILLDEQPITVVGDARHHSGTALDPEFDGLYLTIRYDEERIADQSGNCASVARGNASMQDRPATGGPSRILAAPLFAWRPFLPSAGSGEILLAQVELNDACSAVQTINPGDRRYIGPASSSTVRQFALEGERHIDQFNPGRIRFHIRGRQPNAVTLYLRSEKFSTLFYSELGYHSHGLHVNIDSLNLPQHVHGLTAVPGGVGTGSAGVHTHTIDDIRANSTEVADPNNWGFLLVNPAQLVPLEALGVVIPFTGLGVKSMKAWGQMTIAFANGEGGHSHALPAATDPAGASTIAISGAASTLDSAGASDAPARNTAATVARTFVEDLRIFIGKSVDQLADKTADVLNQLRDAQPTEAWTKLGLGTGASTDTLCSKGSGPIRLDFIPGISFSEGEFIIDLQLNSGGGRILYNLYVE